MKTLEELLKMKVTATTSEGNITPEFSPDFRVAVQNIHHNGVHIIIHPFGHNGDTLDFIVSGNKLSNVGGGTIEAVLLTTKDGDWEGLFINGKLISQGHQLGEGEKETFWLDIGSKYGISGKELLVHEIIDIDDEFVAEIGSFPKNIGELSGEYVRHID